MGLANPIHLTDLRGDLFGGVTAAIGSLPIAQAFGGESYRSTWVEHQKIL